MSGKNKKCCTDVRCALPSDHAGPCMDERAICEVALAEAQAAQASYWDALHRLETALADFNDGEEVEVDGNRDLEDLSVEDLLEEAR